MQTTLGDLASKLQAIIDTAIDGIIVIDVRGQIEEINQSALHLFGYDKSELIGKNVSTLMPSPDRENHTKYIERFVNTREPKIIGIGREVVGLTKSGRQFPFRLAVSEVQLADRVVFTGIVHDLTAIKAAEADRARFTQELEERVVARTNELEQAVNRLLSTNQKLEKEVVDRQKAEELLRQKENELKFSLQKEKELNELKSRFMSMASHEFRTPLSTILSSVALIARYPHTEDDEKRQKHINRIKSSISNLNGILNDFMSLGKLEEGKVALKVEVIDLGDLCQDIKEDLEGMLKPGQEIIFDFNGKVQSISCDSRILKNVFFNLLSNAIKYSNEKQPISCVLNFKEKEVQVDIIDRGIGIPESEQHHLFDRFFRASNAGAIQGTGLGLNIVQKYLELIGGSITYTSELNKGSTFTFTVPKNSSL